MSMHRATKPAFQAVEIDLIDRRLDVQAAEKGIPTLIAPKVEPGEPVAEAPPAVPVAAPEPRRARPAPKSTPRAKMKTLNIEVPDYAWMALKMRHAKEMVSVRYLVLTALREIGIEINEVDMIEDGRRYR
jgi:hypothetical protein